MKAIKFTDIIFESDLSLEEMCTCGYDGQREGVNKFSSPAWGRDYLPGLLIGVGRFLLFSLKIILPFQKIILDMHAYKNCNGKRRIIFSSRI